eukprot:522367-Lingulodinium_polyedra.AAC.1
MQRARREAARTAKLRSPPGKMKRRVATNATKCPARGQRGPGSGELSSLPVPTTISTGHPYSAFS